MSDVLLTEGIDGPAFAALAADWTLRHQPEPGRPTDELAGVRALVVRNRTQVGPELLAAAPDLAVVARAGVGLDNIDLPAADRRGVAVIAPLGANARSVAELTLGLALDLARGVTRLDRSVRAGGWDRTPGRELSGRTWGLLGAGATGRAVAELATALGMSVLAHDPYLDGTATGLSMVELPELLARSDVLSVHVPATPDTHGLLDADRLAALHPDALLINVGRGEVVDEAALAAALAAGRLGGAALDVRTTEPPGPGPLDACDNVVFTPHIAGITVESQARINAALAQGIGAVLAGQPTALAVGAVKQVAR